MACGVAKEWHGLEKGKGGEVGRWCLCRWGQGGVFPPVGAAGRVQRVEG
jgi:hypothetical protein